VVTFENQDGEEKSYRLVDKEESRHQTLLEQRVAKVRVGGRLSTPARGEGTEGLMLVDSGAESRSWISHELAQQLELKREKIKGESFFNRLFPGQYFTTDETVQVEVYLEREDVTLPMECTVFPPRAEQDPEREDIVMGTRHQNLFEVSSLRKWKRAPVAPELDETVSEDELDSLQFGEMIAAAEEEDEWLGKICPFNFPVGSEERRELIELLLLFKDRVLADRLEGSMANMEPMDVPLRPGEAFEGVPARRYSRQAMAVIREWLDKMLLAGVIQVSTSNTSSPLLVVADPSGKHRVTQDVSVLNKKLVAVRGTIPEIQSIVDGMKGMTYLGAFDLILAYHQCPASPTMRSLWAFSTPFGSFEYTDRLPMGDKNVPVVFSNFMASMIKDAKGASSYFDDILTGAKTKKEFIHNCREVLEACEKANVKLSWSKLRLGFSKIDALGYEVSGEGYSPRKRNIDKFLQAEFPKKEALLKWLGLLNVFRRFIPDFMEIREAFVPVTKKGAPYDVTEEMIEAFERAKVALAGLQQLHHINPDKELILDTDACDYGVGCCLYQLDDDGTPMPILFESQLLSESARGWDTKSKEAYAIFKALKSTEYLLRGQQFTLRTDHRNLLYLEDHQDAKQSRWWQFISEFDFTMLYVPGPENVVADALSRLGVVHVGGFTADCIEELKPIFDRVHNTVSGHHGINRTVNKMMKVYTQEGAKVPAYLRQGVQRMIASCMHCVKQRARVIKPRLERHSLHSGSFFERIQVDFLEGLPESRAGHKHILVVVCCFSRFTMLFPCADRTAGTVKEHMLLLISIFGHPLAFVSDGGPAFKANEMEDLLKYLNVNQEITYPHHPEGHGIVERVNREIKRHLQHIVNECVIYDNLNWDVALPWVQRVLNNTVHSQTGYAPVTLVFGTVHVEDRNLMGFIPDKKVATDGFLLQHDYLLKLVQDASNQYQDKCAIERMEQGDNAAEASGGYVPTLQPGQWVMHVQPPRVDYKLMFQLAGPHRVVEQADGRDDFYVIEDITQDLKLTAHRERLVVVHMADEQEARRLAAQDTNEITIVEVLSHSGNPQVFSTMEVVCKCEGMEHPVSFMLSGCKLVPVVQEYVRAQPGLKSVLSRMTSTTNFMRRKKNQRIFNDEYTT